MPVEPERRMLPGWLASTLRAGCALGAAVLWLVPPPTEARAALLADDCRGAVETCPVETRQEPEAPLAWLGLAVSQYRLSRDDQAVPSLERALRLQEGLTPAHKLLGVILYRRGDTAAAISHFETAQRQDPNDVGLRTFLAAARQTQALEVGSDRLFAPHFVILYPRPADRLAAVRIADRLEALYRTVGRQLSCFPGGRFAVFLHPARRFRTVTDGPAWARGLFDGRIHLPVEEGVSVPETALVHEYTHALVHRLSGGAAPAWLDEGLALFMEGGGREAWRQVLARHPEEIVSLTTLHGSFLALPHRLALVAYAESAEATRVLIRRHGLSRVRHLLEALPTAPNFAAAFERVFGERYADFDGRWLEAATGTW